MRADRRQRHSAATHHLQLHVWVSRDDLCFLQRLAVERDQSVSAIVRSVLRAHRKRLLTVQKPPMLSEIRP